MVFPKCNFEYRVGDTLHEGVKISVDIEVFTGSEFAAEIQPGFHTISHAHSGEEEITVVSGEGRVTLDGVEQILTLGVPCRVTQGVMHSVRNATKEVLRLRVVFEPPFIKQVTRF